MSNRDLALLLSLVFLAALGLNVAVVHHIASRTVVSVAQTAAEPDRGSCSVAGAAVMAVAGLDLVEYDTPIGGVLVPLGWKCERIAVSPDETLLRLVNPTDEHQMVTIRTGTARGDDVFSLLPDGVSYPFPLSPTVLAYDREEAGNPHPVHGVAELVADGGFAVVEVLLPDALRPAATVILNSALRYDEPSEAEPSAVPDPAEPPEPHPVELAEPEAPAPAEEPVAPAAQPRSDTPAGPVTTPAAPGDVYGRRESAPAPVFTWPDPESVYGG